MKHETKTGRKLLSVLLALAMVIGLLPGISVTASATAPGDNTSGEKVGGNVIEVAATSPYASLVNTTTAITFNDMQWYVIGYDDSTVTLLSKECVAEEINYSSEGSSAYSGSDVEYWLFTNQEGGYYWTHFTEETRTAVYNDKMYLLSLDDAENLSSEVLKCSQHWWLSTSSGGENDARIVNCETGEIIPTETYQYFGVRPVLQLDLSKVTFNATTQTFGVNQTYPIWVGGVQVTSANADNIDGNGKATYDPETNTLTLDGYSTTETYAEADMYTFGIYAEQALHIELKGENSVTNTGSGSNSSGYGIGVKGDLTFSGTGSLTVHAKTRGIAVQKSEASLTFNGGTINVTIDNPSGYKISGTNDITFNGGTVNATGTAGAVGIFGTHVSFNGGCVTASGTFYAVYPSAENGLTLGTDVMVLAGADEATAEDVTATFAANHEQKWVRAEKLVAHTHDDITFQPWTSATSLPSESGSYYLTRDVIISDSWKIEGTYDNSKAINLCLNGYGIRYSGDNGPAVNVYREAELNLYDCNTTRTHYVTLTDGRGTAVSDTPVDGAVAVAGGYITGGFANGGANDAPYMGGGVYVANSPCHFNMYGGTIIGNKAWQGGGVYADNNGEYEACFNMYGGVITRNTAFAGAPGKGVGGGLCVHGTTHMYGGEITGNTAVTGGGVGLAGNYLFYLHGGQITGNTASSQGGGVYVPASANNLGLYLSGSPVITGNTKGNDANNLYVAGRVQVIKAMSTGASIGVTLPGGTGEFASGEPVGDGGYEAYFTSDNTAYSVVVDGFSLYLAAHEHSFTYGAEGAVLTATCTGTVGTCSLTDSKVTLTIAAPTLTTYGGTGSAEATLEGWEAFNAATGQTATATDIRYQGREETTYGESATAPTAPGKYTARITVAEATASVNYEIGKATPTVDDFTFTAPANLTYDGNSKAASVMVEEGVTGMGNVTVNYYSNAACTTEANPVNAGTYYVGITTISGSNYKATEAVLHHDDWCFTISKAFPRVEDFAFDEPSDGTYNGEAKEATVTAMNGVTGMGQVTVKYYNGDHDEVNQAINAGMYHVGIMVSEGDNYYATTTALQSWDWSFMISKAFPLNSDYFVVTLPDNLTYDGNPKSASATVSDGITGMGSVTVKYMNESYDDVENPTDVGTYIIMLDVAEGTNYQSWTLYDPSWHFTIGKTNPAAENFTFTPPADLTYDGTAKSASVTVKNSVNGMGNVTVKYYSDAACTTEANPVNVGTYYVGITVGDGSNYNAASVISDPNWRFSIIKAAPKAEHFTCSTPTDLVYDGTKKSVTIAVKDGVVGMGEAWVNYYYDSNFSGGADPINAGIYFFGIRTLPGANYDAAEIDLRNEGWWISIAKADPNAGHFEYATPTDLTYDGNAKSASVTVRNGVNGMGDVTVQYYSDAQRTIPATPTDVGTYYVGVSVSEGDNYNAAVVYDEAWQFTISKTDPAAKNFTFTAPADLTYDGNAKAASVTAKDGVNGMGGVTVKYYSNAACTTEATPTDVGTYYVGITVGDGSNYNAASLISDPNWRFSITKAAPKAEHFTCSTPTDLVYDGTEKSVATVTVKDGINGMGNVTVKYYSDAARTTEVTPTDAGTYYVGITVAEGKNYNAATSALYGALWQITIAKADPNAGHFDYATPTDLTYDGSAKSASVTVKNSVNGMGDVTVQYYSDAQRTIPATPTDAGTYYVGVSVSEGDNYNAAVVYDEAWQFTISRIDPIADDFDYATPTDLTYDGSAKSATVTAKEGVNGMGDVTVKYYSDAACENEVEPTDAGTYYVGITVAQGKNYNATDTDLRDPSWQFTISKIAPVADDFDYATPTDLTYDGTAKSVPVTAKDGVDGMGDVTVNYYSDAQRTTPATPTDAGTYYVGITVAQGKNYNATDTDLHDEGWHFTIAKADIHPTVSMKNWTEGYRTSEPVLEGNHGEGDVTFTYARQGKDDFTDKKPTSAGRYIVKATVAETANYNGGEATAQFTIYADDSGKLTVTSPLTSVTRVTLNGRVVSPANYIVVGGDVQFTEAFLASLKPGTYTIKVTDGTTTATATYRIAANGVAESTVLSATTGDPGVVLYGLLAVSSTLGLAWMGKKRKED